MNDKHDDLKNAYQSLKSIQMSTERYVEIQEKLMNIVRKRKSRKMSIRYGVLAGTIAATLLLVGLMPRLVSILTSGQNANGILQQDTGHVSAWESYLVLNWKGERYEVTSTVVTRVGYKLDDLLYYGHGEHYNLYSIPGVDPKKAIAVETTNGFLKALGVTNTGQSIPPAPVITSH